MEPDDPPPKKYEFKPKEFERVNAPPPASLKPGAKAGGPPDPFSGKIDVYEILQQNRVVEQRAGLNEVEIKPAKTRRKRDFWQALALGYLVLVGGMAVGHFNVASVVGCGSLMVFYSIGLWWIMFHILSDY